MHKYKAVMLVPIEFDYPATDDKDAAQVALMIASQSVTRLNHPTPVINRIVKLSEPPHAAA
jgi:hypothetical protein